MSIRVVEARELADKQAVYSFLYELWAGELGREASGMDPQRRMLEDGLDAWAHHFMALDGAGNIAGAIRINELHEGDIDTALAERLGLGELLGGFDRDTVSVSSHLAVAPHKRGHTVASRLVAAVVQRMLRRGILLDLSFCALDLVSMYYQVGYRPYLPAFRLPGVGVRQPLVLCPRDLEHLREVESPVASFLPPSLDDDGGTALSLRRIFPDFRDPGFDRMSSRALWARLARSSLGVAELGQGLLDGFEAHELETIAPHVVRQYFLPGQFVYRRGEREPGMGVVLSGSLGVVLAEASRHVVAVLGPSEPFGELQALGPGERSADVVALERSEVLLLPPDFVDRVGRADPELGFRLARRLLEVLAQRLVAANGELLAVGRSSAHPARSRRPAVDAQRPDASELAPSECFAFGTLAAPERQRAASLQALAAGTIELPALMSAGLTDGQTVLDLSAGEGIFATALFRRLPGCRFLGLSQQAEARATAQGILAHQGVAERCRLLEAPERIPLDDDSVDFCYARLLLQRCGDPAAVVAEMCRVTRPGGVVCVLDVDDDSIILHPSPPAWERLRARIAAVSAAEGRDRHIGRKLWGLLRRAGLRGVHTDLLTVTPASMGSDAFASVGFGFIPGLFQRNQAWGVEDQQAYADLCLALEAPDGFASYAGFLVHGLVP